MALLDLVVSLTGLGPSMKPARGNPDGFLVTIPAGNASAVTAPVPNNLTSTPLVAANTARAGLFIFNNSTQVLHLKLATAPMANAADLSTKVAVGATWTMPVGWTGAVHGMLAGADVGAIANCTEITAT